MNIKRNDENYDFVKQLVSPRSQNIVYLVISDDGEILSVYYQPVNASDGEAVVKIDASLDTPHSIVDKMTADELDAAYNQAVLDIFEYIEERL